MAGNAYDDDDKETIRQLGNMWFEKLTVELEGQLHEAEPAWDFHKSGGRGYLDREVYRKHRNQQVLNGLNALEKAARMKKGLIGKEVVETNDDRKDIEDLLKMVQAKRSGEPE